MANGTITGKEVLDGVVEELDKANEAMKTLIKTYDKLIEQTKKAKDSSTTAKLASAAEKQNKALGDQMIRNEKLAQQKLITEQKTAQSIAATNRSKISAIALSDKEAISKQKAERRSKSIAGAYALEAKRLNELRTKFKNLSVEINNGTKPLSKYGGQLKRMGREVRALDANLKRVDASAGQFQRSVGNYGKALGTAGRSFRSFIGAFGLTSGIFLFAKAIKSAASAIVKFDQAQADLAAILGKSKKDIGALTKQAKVLGATTAFTANQVTELQLELSKLGFAEQEILDSTKAVEDFAIATGVEAARAAKLAGAAIRGFNLESTEANRVASALAVSTTKSASSFTTLEIGLPKVAAVATAMNFSLEDTTALLGTLQNAGFEASIGATSLRQIFAKLAKEGGALQEALGGDINGLDDFVKGLKGLRDSGTSLNDILKLVPIRAAAALKVLIQGGDDIIGLRDGITDVSAGLQELTETKLDSVAGDTILLKSAWEGFVISIDDGNGKLSEFVRLVLTGVTAAFNVLTELNKTSAEVRQEYKDGLGVAAASNAMQGLQEDAFRTGQTLADVANDKLGIFQREVLKTTNVVDDLTQKQKDQQTVVDSARGSGLRVAKKKLQEINNQLIAEENRLIIVSANLEAAESLLFKKDKDTPDPDDGALENIKTLNSLRTALKELREEFNDTAIDSPDFPVLKQEVKELEEEIKRLTKAETEIFAEGTLAALEQQKKALEDEQKITADSADSWAEYQGRIDEVTESINKLKGAREKLQKIMDQDSSAFGATELDKDQQNELQFGFSEKQTEDEIEAALKLEEIKRALRDETTEHLKRATEEETRILEDAFALQADLQKEHEGIWQDAVLAGIDGILGARIEAIDNEIEENQRRLDVLLDSDKVSEEVKADARKKNEIEQRKLERKKREREKQAFLIGQGLALADIAINLAKTLSLIQVTAAAIDTLTLGTGGTPYRLAQTPIAIGTAAAQGAAVLAQSIPAFYKGKGIGDNYEGIATWGERGREVLIREDGSMAVSPNKTTPIMLGKNDLIIPSLSKFDDDIVNPNSDVFQRVSQKINYDTESRTKAVVNNNTMDLTPLQGLITKELRNALKGVNINVNAGGDSDKYDHY